MAKTKNSLEINADELKSKILDLAMRGKLVKQDPNDEPASVLLEKIMAEKEELVKEKKFKKTKPLPEITDDEKPFDIPDSWEWVRLGDVANITKLAGFEYTKYIKPNLQNEGIPLFKAKNIHEGKIISNFENYISNELSDSLQRSQLNKKCLLTPYVGSIGNVAIFSGKYKAHLGSNVGKIEMISNGKSKVIEEFTMQYLRSLFGYQQLTKHLKSTAQPSISITALRDVFLPVPSFEEQKRITTKIDQLFAQVDKIEKASQEYDDLKGMLKEKVLDLAMRGKLVKQDPNDEPASVLLEKIQAEKAELVKEKKIKKTKPLPEITDDEKPFNIPDSWEWVRLGDIAKIITKGTTPKGGKLAYMDQGIKFYRAENVKEYVLNTQPIKYISNEVNEKQLQRSALELKDLLITIAGTLGNVAIVEQNNLPGNVNQAIAIVRLVDINNLNENFLSFALGNQSKEIINQKKTTSIPNLTLRQITETAIPLPPFEEQNRIVEKIDQIFSVID